MTVSTVLTNYLVELFSLSSADQVIPVSFTGLPGVEAVPFKFLLHQDNGEELAVFVKLMDGDTDNDPLLAGYERQDMRGFLRHEASFYQRFLPEIERFLKEHGQENLADEVKEMFPKFYGFGEKGSLSFLVLEDVTAKGFIFDVIKIGKDYSISKAAISKLGELSGIFYAWQHQTSPPDDYFGPPFSLCKFIKNSLLNGGVHKLFKLLKESPPGRFEKLPPVLPYENIAATMAAIENSDDLTAAYTTEMNLMCPTLGDFHPNNIAISESGDRMKFFDFTHYRMRNVMAEVQRYCGIASHMTPHRIELRDAYINSFIKSSTLLNESVPRERLIDEYHNTNMVYVSNRLFIISYVFFTVMIGDMTKPMINIKSLVAADQGSEEAKEEVYRDIDNAGKNKILHFWLNVDLLCNLFKTTE